MPPFLPVSLIACWCCLLLRILRTLVARAYNNHRLVSRTDIAELLPGFALNHCRVFVVSSLLTELGMLALELLQLLLIVLYFLHQLAI